MLFLSSLALAISPPAGRLAGEKVEDAPVPSPVNLADAPNLWQRALVAVVMNPFGIVGDGAVEFRTPVMRYGGAIFNATFLGAGVRATATPVHMELAARVTWQPMDILPITVEAWWGSYWKSPWSPVPMDRVKDQRLRDRKPQYDAGRDFVANTFGINVMPTFQFQVKRIVGLTSWNLTYMQIRPFQGPEPWVFEPYRGIVMAPIDGVAEHTSALLWEFKSGKDNTSMLRAGLGSRGKFSFATKDQTLTAGLLGMWRPGRKPTSVTMTAMVLPYLRDPDFQLGSPYILIALSGSRLVPLREMLKVK